jgi:hypothetical protein
LQSVAAGRFCGASLRSYGSILRRAPLCILELLRLLHRIAIWKYISLNARILHVAMLKYIVAARMDTRANAALPIAVGGAAPTSL